MSASISAMSEDSPHRRARQDQDTGSPSCPDRILDRKIERRALPQSFSSNLGRRGLSPPRKASDGSVRSMVTLFERSAATSDSPKPKPSRPRLASGASDKASLSSAKEGLRSGHESKRSDNKQEPKDKKTPAAHLTTTTPSVFPAAQVSYQVEDYSLTLLKHKSYFNNRPLARCLDGVFEEDAKTKVQRVKSKKEAGRKLATENNENKQCKRDEKVQESKESGNISLSPVEQLDTLMSELLTWQGISECATPTPGPHCEIRDPEEVKRFWSNVRTQLWVEDVETDGEEPSSGEQDDGQDESVEKNEGQTLEPSISIPSVLSTSSTTPDLERPVPPMPTRPPPPVPVTPRGRSCSATSSQAKQRSTAPSLELFLNPATDYPSWDRPPSTSCVGPSIGTLTSLDMADLLSDEEEPELELPTLPKPGRPLPVPAGERPNHSRYPSSSSGPWTRPPTWRPPSSLQSASPPPMPPLPASIPAPPTTNHPHRRANHVRNRHQPQSSSTTSISVPSAATTTEISSGRSVNSRRTPGASTSSVATRSTRADSGSTDASAASRLRPPPRRRLTTEEKLSEIDAFLSSPDGVGKEGWI